VIRHKLTKFKIKFVSAKHRAYLVYGKPFYRLMLSGPRPTPYLLSNTWGLPFHLSSFDDPARSLHSSKAVQGMKAARASEVEVLGQAGTISSLLQSNNGLLRQVCQLEPTRGSFANKASRRLAVKNAVKNLYISVADGCPKNPPNRICRSR